MTRMAVTTTITLVAAALLATAVSAHVAAPNAFLCPKNPAAAASLWLKSYPPSGQRRGSTWCNDGATAALRLSASPRSAKVPAALRFVGGFCRQAKSGDRYVQIGTRISPASSRKRIDPQGLHLTKPKTNTSTWLELGTPALTWENYVKITWSGLRGTYSGTSDVLVGGAVRKVTVAGSFVCRRIVKTAR